MNNTSTTLDEVVPFGRLSEEYRLMFGLTPEDWNLTILGVGDGPASFNAEATSAGWNVVSVDPICVFSAAEIRQRFDAVVDPIIGQVCNQPDRWTWKFHRDPEHLREHREAAIIRFSEDFRSSTGYGCYIAGEFPSLPFSEQSFDLALCSHLLFLYSHLLDLDFHMASVGEMLRVAREVRIFPLLEMNDQSSRHLDAVIEGVERQGHAATVEQVDYCLQKGGDQQLVIRKVT
jgi:hypothetical protein